MRLTRGTIRCLCRDGPDEEQWATGRQSIEWRFGWSAGWPIEPFSHASLCTTLEGHKEETRTQRIRAVVRRAGASVLQGRSAVSRQLHHLAAHAKVIELAEGRQRREPRPADCAPRCRPPSPPCPAPAPEHPRPTRAPAPKRAGPPAPPHPRPATRCAYARGERGGPGRPPPPAPRHTSPAHSPRKFLRGPEHPVPLLDPPTRPHPQELPMRRLRSARLTLPLLPLLLTLPACSPTLTDPQEYRGPPFVETVTIHPTRVTLDADAPYAFAAQALDARGRVVATATLVWSARAGRVDSLGGYVAPGWATVDTVRASTRSGATWAEAIVVVEAEEDGSTTGAPPQAAPDMGLARAHAGPLPRPISRPSPRPSPRPSLGPSR